MLHKFICFDKQLNKHVKQVILKNASFYVICIALLIIKSPYNIII